ncbi:MAG: hypothetical protein MUF51_10235, partial [Vicinamibacteria bacterium]|nr:hypothetical protein [Vicinamibacteria bacterium]
MRPCECSPIVIRFERCAAVFALALFSAPLSVWAQAAPAPPAVSLDRTTLPAKGKQAAILTVARPGAYAVTVKSPQGTSLQLVDRMTGPQAIQGRAGESDGRLDLLLKQGEYKIVARSHERGQGAAVLRVHPLLEKNAPPPLLVELKDVATTLEDFEQRSYWLKLDVRQRVILEAAGRHLDNLRLWKDGAWLIDAETENQIAQPRIGKPLRVCRLTADLEPGLYLLTAYGAAGQVWSQDDGARPLYIRYGLPRAGAAGRTRSEISPFGYDRVLVPGPTNYFRIELPEARPAALVVGRFDADAPFGTEGERAEVTKKSVPPAADMTVDGLETYAWHVATISGEAGQPYVLQHFVERWEYSFGGQGDYWIGSVHSGTAEDSFDATAILVDREQNVSKPRITPMADRAIVLDRSTSYARRANLLDSATLFFNIRDTGTYEIVATGVKARFRFEPFLLNLPPRYQAPPLGASGSTWDLDAGLYVLTMLPIEKGILNLTVRPKGLIAAALDTVGAARVNAQTQGAVRFERVTLDPTHHYTVFLSRQPEVHAGLIVRELPLDLGDALFVAQAAGETVNVSFKAAEAGALVAMAEDGKSLELSIDNGAWQASPVVSAGRHSVAVRHDRGTSVPYALRFAPTRLSRQAALPAIPQTELDALPKLPVLKPAETVFLDLKRESAASYMLPVEKPGLYRIESSGLLALSGNLR